MRLVLERVPDDPQLDGVAVRLLVLNDSYEPVRVDRRLLIGPNLLADAPRPVSAEPSLPDEEDNVTVLAPGGVVGRQRSFADVSGTVTCHGYLLREDGGAALGPQGPLDAELLLVRAEPLVLELG